MVPASNGAVQLVSSPQLIPAGEEVTVPVPLPPALTVRVTWGIDVEEVLGSDDEEEEVGAKGAAIA